MKKIIVALVLIVSFMIPPAAASAQGISIGQLVELFIGLGIIAPDKADAARSSVGGGDTTAIKEVSSLTITSPSEGVSLKKGSTYEVTWASVNVPTSGTVTVDLSVPGSGAYYGIGYSKTANGKVTIQIPLEVAPLGNHYIDVTVWDSKNGSVIAKASKLVNITAADTTSVPVLVRSVDGSEPIKVGSEADIGWLNHDARSGPNRFNVSVSGVLNNGTTATEALLTNSLEYQNVGKVRWIPKNPMTSARVRVVNITKNISGESEVFNVFGENRTVINPANPVDISGASARSTIIDNGSSAPFAATVRFSFTMTNVGSTDVLVSKKPNETLVLKSEDALVSTIYTVTTSPAAVAGDTVGYFTIPAGTYRTFVYEGTMNNRNGTLGLQSVKVTQIYYVDAAKPGELKLIDSGLQNLRAVVTLAGGSTITKPSSALVCGNLGDVNGDGKITDVDANLLSILADGSPTSVVQKQASDVNKDGSLTLADVSLLRAYLAGTIKTFSGCSIRNIDPTPITIAEPASVRILSPRGGDSYTTDNSMTIKWEVKGQTIPASFYYFIYFKAKPNQVLGGNVANVSNPLVYMARNGAFPSPTLTFPLSDIAAGSYYIEIDITDQNKNIIATYTTATPITISARNQPLPVITFTANGSTDRLQVSEGANIKLAWNTTKAVSCSNNWAGWPDVSGSTNIIASTATSYFRIVCANANGATESKTIYVTVVPLARTTTTASETPVSSANTTTQTQTTVSEPSVTLTANGTDRLEINAGWNIKLVWNAQNAVSCVNSWDASTAVSGVSAVTANTSTSLYRITCKNASGITQTKTAYVTVLTQAQGTAEASPVSRATDKTLDSSVFASVLSGFMSVIDYLVR